MQNLRASFPYDEEVAASHPKSRTSAIVAAKAWLEEQRRALRFDGTPVGSRLQDQTLGGWVQRYIDEAEEAMVELAAMAQAKADGHEAQQITGHLDARMLMHYYHPDAQHLGAKLEKADAERAAAMINKQVGDKGVLKPAFFRDMLAQLYPVTWECERAVKLELFARERARGWKAWGNQAPKKVGGQRRALRKVA